MKKNIFILALAVMFISATAMAQTAAPKKAETKKECCKAEAKGDKACCGSAKTDGCKGEKGACKSDKKATAKK
ncbi:MAG: hypothetical protein AUK44_02550 [Porphyromonadaceae bacterium CG2_30_38_12]|nr:MAG: hypothetical protein AUK44_02550 [Porphyromonadaceae bacterium CG2_30_38_12]